MIFISNCEIMSWLINSTNKKGSILKILVKLFMLQVLVLLDMKKVRWMI